MGRSKKDKMTDLVQVPGIGWLTQSGCSEGMNLLEGVYQHPLDSPEQGLLSYCEKVGHCS